MHESLPASFQRALIGYGVRLLACQLGQPLPLDGPLTRLLRADDAAAGAALAWARRQLDDDAPLERPAEAGRLRSIFSLLYHDDERRRKAAESFLPRRPLDLDLGAGEDMPAADLWAAFAERAARLRPGPGQLESFAALLARYGSSVAGSLDLPGISAYEQFRAVAALVATLPPGDETLLLVEGDLSGIQEMLYTITAKGAAKNLRGRSLYLQLLSDALARAILHALALPGVCLVYSAGGGFRLLARAGDAPALAEARRELNQRLLRLHGGELALALAWAPVAAADLTGAAFAQAAGALAELVDEQKARAFADLVTVEPGPVAGVVGSGSDHFCEICHVELPDTRFLRASGGEADALRCDQCDGFGERVGNVRPGESRGRRGLARLAADAARDLDAQLPTYLAVTVAPLPALPDPSAWYGHPAWETALAALGVSYHFTGRPRPGPGVTIYRLNASDCLPEDPSPECAYSFRFLALSTPRVTEEGAALERLRAFLGSASGARSEEEPGEATAIAGPTPEEQATGETREELQPGAIRTLTLMARWDSTGIERYGVLRMDIDDLGRLFHRRMERPGLLHSAALSAALTRFFEGWLNVICTEVAEDWQGAIARVTDDAGWQQRMRGRLKLEPGAELPARGKLPYVIYAGGDDLFVVGPWDVLPALAARIRRDLCSYVLRGYVERAAPLAEAPVTLSAGIVAESALYPLYQAADQAGEALRAAKRRTVRQAARGPAEWATVKDAITLLGVTVSWDELAQAERLAHTLARLIDVGVLAEERDEPNRAPHALIQLLAGVARSYADAGGEAAEERLAYGRWMPLLAYGLRRMADRAPAYNPELRRQILGLAGEALDLTRVAGAAQWHTMRFLGLPVRWAQLLIRTGG